MVRSRKPVPTYSLKTALEASAAIIRTHGYISKKEAATSGRQPTSVTLGIWLNSPATTAPVIDPADVAKAREAWIWLDAIATSPKTGRETDFDMAMRNLLYGGYRLVDAGLITKSDFGFVACVYATMDRAANREKKKEDAKAAASASEYIGKLKKRDEFFVKLVAVNYSQNVGCHIFKVMDRKGNLGVFFSSAGPDEMGVKVSECFLAKMTPKRHSVNDYHGGKETIFNRVKVVQNVGAPSE